MHAIFSLGKVTLTYHGETQTVDDAFVSGDYFTTLGVAALLGRTLTPAPERAPEVLPA